MGNVSRRTLLQYTAATAALAASGAGIARETSDTEAGFEPTRHIVINYLGFIANPNLRLQQEQQNQGSARAVRSSHAHLDERALQDLQASGTSALNVTLGHVAGPAEPFEYTVREIAAWNRIIATYPQYLIKIRRSEDVLEAHSSGRTGVIFGFQNTTMLGEDPERVQTFAGLGVKVVQLTYNVDNHVGAGSMVPVDHGLTEFGHQVVQQLNANATLVDLSHSGQQTCLDAIEASSSPICISHTGCRALADLPRNKTDRELRLLADSGGVAGIYFMPFLKEDSFPDANDVVRHIEHAIKVCGEDHVGIGTDGGTTAIDDMPAYHEIIDREIRARQEAGIAARGEKDGVVPFLPDLQGPGQFRQLAGLLKQGGMAPRVVEKVMGLNFLRLQREVWGG